MRTFAILASGMWSFVCLADLPQFGVSAPITAIAALARSGWWVMPVLLASTVILLRARRLVVSRRDAVKMGVVLAQLAWYGVFAAIFLEWAGDALATRQFAGWLLGPVVLATGTAVYAVPWLTACVWPRGQVAPN